MWVLQMLISFLLAISSYVYQGQVILASKYRPKRDLVAHTGFEPVISSLRGRCPKPLDECASKIWLGIQDSNLALRIQSPPSYR